MRLPAICLAVGLVLATSPEAETAPVRPAAALACNDDSGWNDPAKPFRLYGNTWYVGTCGITALLVTSPAGHVLLDAGTEKSAPLVEASIRAAGFRLRDIRYIVNSHAHHDHAGGIAYLQRASGATVLARAPSVATLARGVSDATDPQAGTTDAFPAVASLRALREGEVVKVGPLTLTPHATPGHMPGSTSWTWRSCERERCLDIAYVDSLSAIASPGFRFSDSAAHPGVLDDFRASLRTVAALPCDIAVTTHPAAGDLWSRVGAGATRPLAEPGACRALAEAATRRLDARIADEATP